MGKLLSNRTTLITIIGVVLVVGFVAYTIIPSNLPKPIYIEFVSAESEPPERGQARSETGQAQSHPAESTHEPTGSNPPAEGASMLQFEVGDGIMYDAGARVVNLLDPVGRRYLKINIILEFLPPDYKYYQLEGEKRELEREKLLEEIATRKPIIDDMLTSLLTSQTYEDIYTLEGKNRLRLDIQEGLNELLQEPRIVAVYFTDFLIH